MRKKMINIEEFEKDLVESLNTETGKPFNKWIGKTKSELIQESIERIKSLNSEIELHKNELVIDNNKVVVLMGVADGVEDFYWIYKDWDDKEYLASCVGRHIRLKGYIPEEEYNRLVYVWNLNHLDQVV